MSGPGPVKTALVENLRELHLPTMLACFEDTARRTEKETFSCERYLLELRSGSVNSGRAIESAVGKDGFLPQEYSKALGRTITYPDIPVDAWREGLLQHGLSAHLANHLAAMADLHRAGRYDRMTDDVFALTGQKPPSMTGIPQEQYGDIHRFG